MNIKEAIDYSTKTEYEKSGVMYNKLIEFNTLPM